MGDLWLKLADAMETALARKGRVSKDIWSDHTTVLVPLQVGDNVLLQVLMDGSRRLTSRKVWANLPGTRISD